MVNLRRLFIVMIIGVAGSYSAISIMTAREVGRSIRSLPVALEGSCVGASLTGQPLVNGLAEVTLPAFPSAKRLSYGDGTVSQYVAKATVADILSYYQDRLSGLCWRVAEQAHNRVVYKKGSNTVQVALLANPVSGKTVIDYRLLGKSRVLGDVTCAADQVKCWDSANTNAWCQTGPCPTYTTPPSGSGSATTCSGDQVMCYGAGSTSGWCQIPPCPSNNTYTTSPSCSGSYQQPNITSPSCNYGTCPNGCTWDSSGCPSGCSASTGTTYNSSCPAGQYWCNGSCISSGSYCGPSGGGSQTGTQEDCTRNGGLWCQPTSSPHCHPGPNPGPCEPDTSYQTSCPSGQYMCNGACIPTNSSCSPTTWPSDQASCSAQGKTWCTPSYGGAGWCQTGSCPSSTPGSSCPSDQYLCNGTCIPMNTPCSGGGGSTNWPTDQTSCTNQGKVWCLPTTGSGSAWCQSYGPCPSSTSTPTPATPTPTPTPQPTPNCGSGYYYCETKQSCLPSNIACGSSDIRPTQPAPGPGGEEKEKWQAEEDNRRAEEERRRTEEEKRWQEERLRMMQQGIKDFVRGVEQMKKMVERMKPRLARLGIGIPAELTNALAKAPELIAKIKAANTVEDVEDVMMDLQDVGQTMQEWGPRFGDLTRLGQMLQQAQKKDLRELNRAQARVKTYVKTRPELAGLVTDLTQLAQDMSRAVADAKELAKTDPEAALDKLDSDFYNHMEEFWNMVATIDTVRDLRRGLRQADSEIRRAEQTIRRLERSKASAEVIIQLKDILGRVKTILPELRNMLKQKPLDYETLRDTAEEFWQLVREFENTVAEESGISFYQPKIGAGESLKLDLPDAFLKEMNLESR